MKTWRVGTRGSLLSHRQTDWVLTRLSEIYEDFTAEKVVIRTLGDRIGDRPLHEVGGKGFFVKEIEEALLAGRVDFAVHSLKDLPTELPVGLCLGAVCHRVERRDVIILPGAAPRRAWEDVAPELKKSLRVGTSSPRRQVQLVRWFPQWEFINIRGNIDTRLRKLDSGQCDVLIVAGAGLIRLGLEDRIAAFVPIDVCCPAPGQGALAVEMASHREDVDRLIRPLNDPDVLIETVAERTVVEVLQAGCRTPLGACALRQGDRLILDAVVAFGPPPMVKRCRCQTQLTGSLTDQIEQACRLGQKAGEHLKRNL